MLQHGIADNMPSHLSHDSLHPTKELTYVWSHGLGPSLISTVYISYAISLNRQTMKDNIPQNHNRNLRKGNILDAMYYQPQIHIYPRWLARILHT